MGRRWSRAEKYKYKQKDGTAICGRCFDRKRLEGDREKDETGNCETSNTGKRPRPCSDDEEDVQEEDGEDNNNNIKTPNTSRLLTPGARNVSTIDRMLELESIILFFWLYILHK